MSLKGFHILFITLASLLSLGFGGFALRGWATGAGAAWLAMGVVSLAIGAGLVVYGRWFWRKIRTRDEEDARRRRTFRSLTIGAAAWWLSSRTASACSVCYGEAEGPMIDAARLGVWLLFGMVLAVQFAFLLFFLHLRRRAREHREEHADPRWAER